MNLPTDKEVIEGVCHFIWIDEDGIVNMKAKNVPRTVENEIKTLEQVNEISGNEPVCALIDLTESGILNHETREMLEENLHIYFKAIATVSASIRGEMITRVYKEIYIHQIPLMFFENEEDAKAWLKKYL